MERNGLIINSKEVNKMIDQEMYEKMERELDDQYKIVDEQKRKLSSLAADIRELQHKINEANDTIVKQQKEIFKLRKELSKRESLCKHYKEIMAIELELNE